jgi:bidirectional [NiFe] hydrogenase diaphorase subunit
MGITLREIIEEIGGGVAGGKAFKAAQTGGPSGGCIPLKHIDTPMDYDSLLALGSIMGSGGLIVMDEDVAMPDVARFFMRFCMDESCGKCLPCRAGTYEMHELLDALIGGRGTAATLARLETLCEVVRTNSLCGLGQTAPNPVLSTLHYFRPEYEALLVPDGAQLAGLPGAHVIARGAAAVGTESAPGRAAASERSA